MYDYRKYLSVVLKLMSEVGFLGNLWRTKAGTNLSETNRSWSLLGSGKSIGKQTNMKFMEY